MTREVRCYNPSIVDTSDRQSDLIPNLSRLTWIYKYILNSIPLPGDGDGVGDRGSREGRGEGWSNPEGLLIRSIGRVNLI